MEKKKRLTKLLIGVIGICFLFLTSNVSLAEGLNFSVTYEPGGTQIDRSKPFYYIETVPKNEQEILATVTSNVKEEITIQLSALNAFTQSNGEVGYTDQLELNDPTLKEPITSMVSFPEKEIKLKNHEKKLVKIKVKAPEKSYEGVKAGAILFTQVDKQKKTGVANEYSYRIGLMTSENSDDYNNSKSLNLVEAKLNPKKGRKLVSGVLQNPEAKFLNNLAIKGTIVEKKSGRVIKERVVDNFKMAPNSRFDFDFDWGIKQIPSGSYTFKVSAQNSHETWELSKDFSISEEQAKKINSQSNYQLTTPKWVKIVTIILLATSVLIIILIYIRKQKREIKWKKLSITKKRHRQSKSKRKR